MPSRLFRIGRSATGLGLFAIKPIRRTDYIATYRGRRLADEEATRRDARGAKYLFVVNSRWTIDGSPRWNVARYLNHSCRPNAKAVGRNGGIVFVALRRIEPDEEITIDYGREYYLHFVANGGCRCAPAGSRPTKRLKQKSSSAQGATSENEAGAV